MSLAEPTPGQGEAAPADQQAALLATLLAAVLSIRDSLAGPPKPPAELLDAEAAAALVGLGVSTWYRLVAANQVPPAVSVPGVSCPRWRRRDLLDFVSKLRPARRRPRLAATGAAVD